MASPISRSSSIRHPSVPRPALQLHASRSYRLSASWSPRILHPMIVQRIGSDGRMGKRSVLLQKGPAILRGEFDVAPRSRYQHQLLRSAPAGAYRSMCATIFAMSCGIAGPQQCGAIGSNTVSPLHFGALVALRYSSNNGTPFSPVCWIGVRRASLVRLIATYARPVIAAACASLLKATSKRGLWAAATAGTKRATCRAFRCRAFRLPASHGSAPRMD